jgi:hypothetical protein
LRIYNFSLPGKNFFRVSSEGGLVIRDTPIIAMVATMKQTAAGMIPGPTTISPPYPDK